MDNKNYNNTLQPYANALRKSMTKAEASLWKYVLRAGEMKGFNFRRQRPIGNYIVDFVCFDPMLVIEVDGYSHLLLAIQEKDKIKSEFLLKLGYQVIRFTDAEVLNDISSVIRRLESYTEGFTKSPPPAPASRG